MRSMFLAAATLLAAGLMPQPVQAQSAAPQIKNVQPDTGKSGDLVTIIGENLGHANIAALYLTDDKNDTKVPMLEQTSASIRFKIPASLKPGRQAVMFLTAGKSQTLIEEPFKLTIQ